MVEAKPLVVQVVEACNSRQIRTARAVFIMPVVDAESPTLFALSGPYPQSQQVAYLYLPAGTLHLAFTKGAMIMY